MTLLRCIFKLSLPAPLRKFLPGMPLPSFLYPLTLTAGRRAQGATQVTKTQKSQKHMECHIKHGKEMVNPRATGTTLIQIQCVPFAFTSLWTVMEFFICVRSWRPLGLYRPQKTEVPRAARSYPRVGSRPLTLVLFPWSQMCALTTSMILLL